MSVKLKVLSAGALFFLAQGFNAQSDTAKVRDIDEVVVVGYGTQKKKDVTASLSSVKGAALADKPVQTFDQALAGRSTGVQITVPSGVLNAAPVFRIRGVNSISLSSYPLVIVDGVPSFTGNNSSTDAASNPLASINPADIESVEIAKDAAATAIYGSRAANGVVFITTKKGKNGKARVNYSNWLSLSSPYRLPQTLNAEEYIKYKTMAAANNPAASAVNFTNIDAAGRTIDTDWADIVYRTGVSYNHNINVSGGMGGTSYYFSAGYTDQEGIVQKNDFKRISALLNVDSKISRIFSLGGKLSFSNERNLAAANSGSLAGGAFGTGGLGRLQFVLPSILPVYNADGTYNLNGAAIGHSPFMNGVGSNIGYYNPQFLLDNNRSNSENNRVQSNAYFQAKPFEWLTARTQFGIDYLLTDNDLFWSPKAGDGFSYGGYALGISDKNKTMLWTNTLQAEKDFDRHNLNVLVGNEQTWGTYSSFGIQRDKIADPEYDVVQAGFVNNNPIGMGKSENYLVSFFGRANYNFDDRYYISGNIRQDEYSALSVKKGRFWGVSAGWEVAKEPFWSQMGAENVFSSFKLRGSYGKVGNIGGIGDFRASYLYGSGLYGGASTLLFGQVGNPDLHWETSKKLDVGVSFAMLKNRLTGDITYYDNKIDDLILFIQQSPSTGLPTSVPQNIGSMYNKGWEFDLKADVVRTEDFSWNSGFNISLNENKVTALAPDMPNLQTATSGLETVNRTMPGYSIGYLFVVKTNGVDPQTGKRIFVNSKGENVYYQYYAPAGTYNWSLTPDGTTRTNAVSIADGYMAYNTQPKFYGGFDNTFRYKNFDLNAMLTFQGGNYVYYGSNAGLHDQRWWNNHVDVLTDAWMQPGDTGKKYAKPVFNDNVSNGSSMPLDVNVFKGDFIKLKNLTLGYSLPKEALSQYNINNIRVYVSGQNLAIITKYPGPDPEVSSNGNIQTAPGVDRNTVGNARTVLFGLNVGF